MKSIIGDSDGQFTQFKRIFALCLYSPCIANNCANVQMISMFRERILYDQLKRFPVWTVARRSIIVRRKGSFQGYGWFLHRLSRGREGYLKRVVACATQHLFQATRYGRQVRSQSIGAQVARYLNVRDLRAFTWSCGRLMWLSRELRLEVK